MPVVGVHVAARVRRVRSRENRLPAFHGESSVDVRRDGIHREDRSRAAVEDDVRVSDEGAGESRARRGKSGIPNRQRRTFFRVEVADPSVFGQHAQRKRVARAVVPDVVVPVQVERAAEISDRDVAFDLPDVRELEHGARVEQHVVGAVAARAVQKRRSRAAQIEARAVVSLAGDFERSRADFPPLRAYRPRKAADERHVFVDDESRAVQRMSAFAPQNEGRRRRRSRRVVLACAGVERDRADAEVDVRVHVDFDGFPAAVEKDVAVFVNFLDADEVHAARLALLERAGVVGVPVVLVGVDFLPKFLPGLKPLIFENDVSVRVGNRALVVERAACLAVDALRRRAPMQRRVLADGKMVVEAVLKPVRPVQIALEDVATVAVSSDQDAEDLEAAVLRVPDVSRAAAVSFFGTDGHRRKVRHAGGGVEFPHEIGRAADPRIGVRQRSRRQETVAARDVRRRPVGIDEFLYSAADAEHQRIRGLIRQRLVFVDARNERRDVDVRRDFVQTPEGKVHARHVAETRIADFRRRVADAVRRRDLGKRLRHDGVVVRDRRRPLRIDDGERAVRRGKIRNDGEILLGTAVRVDDGNVRRSRLKDALVFGKVAVKLHVDLPVHRAGGRRRAEKRQTAGGDEEMFAQRKKSGNGGGAHDVRDCPSVSVRAQEKKEDARERSQSPQKPRMKSPRPCSQSARSESASERFARRRPFSSRTSGACAHAGTAAPSAR